MATIPSKLPRYKELPYKPGNPPKTAWGLFGENDGYIPQSAVDKIRAALAAAGVRHDVVVYPGVGHGFFCDERGDYDEAAASDAWRRVKELFRSELA